MADGGKLIIKIFGDDSAFEGTAKKLGKTVLASSAAVSAAVVGIGTAAIKAYGEYEQLVGGVETLFKDAADSVVKNSGRAFETAGLSANKYMETVTSFSASLLQSVGGDTKKAMELADMAVTDMSDNANKMGSDMNNIILTYQSLARGNFAMLDNLKLGYGGTKKELERLLADAEKISGIKFDMSSFADVTQAIHIIQTEMGITGTTAKEAATTIQGSFKALQGAWTNLMTGLTDPSADIDKLLDDVLRTAKTFMNNLMPRIEQVLGGISTMIIELAPPLMNAIMGLIPKLLPAVAEGVKELGKAIVTTVPKIAPQLLQAGKDILAEIVNGMKEELPTVSKLLAILGASIAALKISSVIMGIVNSFKVLKVASVEYAAAMTAVSAVSARGISVGNLLLSTMKSSEIIIGMLTGKITLLAGAEALATKAQLALNAAWKANPVGVVITAVAALTAGIVLLHKAVNSETEAEKQYREAIEAQNAEIQKNIEAREERLQAIKDSGKESLTEMEYIKKLSKELLNYTDANGKVKEGYEDRARFILGKLNESLGTEYSMVGNLINQYEELKNKIYEVIDAKKLEIQMKVAEDSWKEAYTQSQNVEGDAVDAQKTLDDLEAQRNALESELDKAKALKEKVDNKIADGSLTVSSKNQIIEIDGVRNTLIGFSESITLIEGKLEKFNKTHAKTIEDLEKSVAEYEECTAVMTGYEDMLERVANAPTMEEKIKILEQWNKTVADGEVAGNSYAKSMTNSVAEAGNAVYTSLVKYENALKAYKSNQNDSTRQLLSDAKNELNNNLTKYYSLGGDMNDKLITGFNKGKFEDTDISPMLKRLEKHGIDIGLLGKKLGGDFASGFAIGIGNGTPTVTWNASLLANNALFAVKNTQRSQSPAKETQKLGNDFGAGYALGIRRKAKEAADESKKMVEKSVDAMERSIKDNRSNVEKAMDEFYEPMLESEIWYADESERIAEEEKAAKIAVDEAYEKEKKAINKRQKEMKKAYTDEMREADEEQLKNFKDTQEDMLEAQEKANDAYLKGLEETADRERAIFEARKKDVEEAKNAVNDLYSEMVEGVMDSLEEAEDMQSSYADKLKNYGKLYTTETVKRNGKDTEVIKLNDWDKTNEDLRRFSDNLEKIKGTDGVSEEFVKMLRDLSVDEGLELTDHLLKGGERRISDYSSGWEENQALSDEIAKKDYIDETQDAMTKAAEAMEDYTELLEDIAEDDKSTGVQVLVAEILQKMPRLMDVIGRAFAPLVYNSSYALPGGGGTVNNYTTYTERAPIRIDGNIQVEGRTFGKIVLEEGEKEANRIGKTILSKME